VTFLKQSFLLDESALDPPSMVIPRLSSPRDAFRYILSSLKGQPPALTVFSTDRRKGRSASASSMLPRESRSFCSFLDGSVQHLT